MRCLEERHDVLLKVDSVADFKNIFQGTYKDIRSTLTETVLTSFLLSTLNIFLFAEALSEATTQGIYEKQLYYKTFGIFQVKIWHDSFIAKQLSAVSCL